MEREREREREREKEGGGADGGELSDFISGEVCLYGSYSDLITRHRGEGSPEERELEREAEISIKAPLGEISVLAITTRLPSCKIGQAPGTDIDANNHANAIDELACQ